MTTVLILGPVPPPPCWRTQFVFDDILFTNDPAATRYDWVVVYNEVPRASHERFPLACAPEHTILATSEPPSIKTYTRAFTRQFGYVLTTHPAALLHHPAARPSLGAFEWFYNRGASPVALMDAPMPEKTELISTVCSAKRQRHTEHWRRHAFVERLSAEMPELAWFGHGVRALDSKADALDPYKYHVAIENYFGPGHWTEKLSDAFLGGCLPLYAGDPTIGEIFPEESFVALDLADFDRAVATVRETIASGAYERRRSAVAKARELVLTRYNLPARVAALVAENRPATPHPVKPGFLLGRHALRATLPGALSELRKFICLRRG